MNEEVVNFVNETSKEHQILNRLYGIRMKESTVEGLIAQSEEAHFWLPIYQLCTIHERSIKKWLELGGEIK